MADLYKVIKETTNYGHGIGNDVLTLKVGDTFEGDTNGSTDFVYTTLDKKAPDFNYLGGIFQDFVSVPLSSVEIVYFTGALPPPQKTLTNGQKWMWVVGLTLAAWGLLYWSQKEKK
jgi:hypothetical protein